MKTKNLSFCSLAMLLGGALLINRASAQPATTQTVKSTPPLTLAELETFIGGRTKLTLDLKDATLEDAAATISASSGVALKTRPKTGVAAPPGMANVARPSEEPVYSFQAKDEPFWEAFLKWQLAARAAWKAEPLQSDIVLIDGRMVPRNRRTIDNLGLFQLQKTAQDFNLVAGNPFPEGRSIASWPYVMVGTRLNRNQSASLDEDGLQTIEDSNRGRMLITPPQADPAKLAAPEKLAAPTTPKALPTEEERWLDGLTFNTQVYLDPKIKPLNLRCDIEEATDDQGNDLRASIQNVSMSDGMFTQYSSGLSASTSLSIPLGSKPKMGKKLVKLRGVLRFSLVTRSQHWESADPTTVTGGSIWRDNGQFAVQFKGLVKTGDVWHANFSAQSEGDHLKQLWTQWNQRRLRGIERIFGGSDFGVKVIDDAGNTFTSSFVGSIIGLGTKPGTLPPVKSQPGDSPVPADIENWRYTEDAEIQLGSLSSGGSSSGRPVTMVRPVKIILDLPIERREVAIPFEFTNLPLPPS